ncbi:hypothetical protein [Paenibacillus eucommiae]|uniref:Uncharacterized protein n=1 Tax=Paenibacillus eucommiae TaxID=1355755 RepID=A0ABS4IMA5_9BACL|nr:hypothetical protein [Paenibacillus eucommiae]MBP1988695.1 hypothetical protein [Paenibacillus eucommiae]
MLPSYARFAAWRRSLDRASGAVELQYCARGDRAASKLGTALSYKGCSLQLSLPGELCYPVRPFDSYSQKQRENLQEAFLVVRVELDRHRPVCGCVLIRRGESGHLERKDVPI